jgi:23S rRNA pseudouridine1911/1915/1917 synthase
MEDIKIAYKSKEILVIIKPSGMPSQSDQSGDKDAMSRAAELLSLSGERSELYIINRLDRVVGGLVLFARSKSCAARLSEMLSDKIVKEYIAVVSGVPEDGRYTDYLYKDARISKSFIVDRKRAGVKEATLDLARVDIAAGDTPISLVKVRLHTGRYHQIRCQLSGRGTPIVGDGKYGSRDKGARYPALWAYSLAFDFEGERIKVTSYPGESEYPWARFNLEKAGDVDYDGKTLL